MNMQFFGKKSIGNQGSWLLPLRFLALLPLGTSKIYLIPSIGAVVNLPGAKRNLSGDFQEQPVVLLRSRRIFFQDNVVNSGGLATYAEAGIGASYRLSNKLSIGLQTRYLMRTSGNPEQDIYYGVGFGDGYRFLATQKKTQSITAGISLTYQLK